MRFLVDALPDYPRECPFYDGCTRICSLDQTACEYFQYGENGIYTEPESCLWLIGAQDKNNLEMHMNLPPIDKDFLLSMDKNGFRLKGDR